MSKKFFTALIMFGIVTILIVFFSIPVKAKDKPINIYVFYSNDCIHCADQEDYFEELKMDDSNLVFIDMK